MSVDPYEEKLWDSELFGKPVLSTSRLIAQGTAPEGWYRYDLQASGGDRITPAVLVNQAVLELHVESILSPVPLKDPSETAKPIDGQFSHGGIKITLREFCKEHQSNYPTRAKAQTMSGFTW